MRDTYVEVNLNNLEYNVNKIINTYKGYKYYFGVVKASCYNHGIKCVTKIIDSGVNYLAVATLKEAIDIREIFKTVRILCLGVIDIEYINECINNNITITVSSLRYAKELVEFVKEHNLEGLVCHIKLNTGMNRLGINNISEFLNTYNLLKENGIKVEGIFTHIYNASNKKLTTNQINMYERICNSIEKSEVEIFHICASEAMENYKVPSFVNGVRLGIIMYGFSDKLKLKNTFRLVSKVIEIHDLDKNDTVGYNNTFKAKHKCRIAVVAIGYADGIIRENKNRYVYINDKKYKIVGNICMDMLFVLVDESVDVGSKVELLKDNDHIMYTAKYLKTIPYEVICNIGSRVDKRYI